jgi:hypothetical protein
MRSLPIDPQRGVPIPWFVDWIDGKPEFRAMDPDKWRRAVRERRCWVCGSKLGVWLTFVLGPMCIITRTTSEPPCHRDCAEYSAIHCPFLARPHMVRREDGMEKAESLGGIPIRRNPGACVLWITRGFRLFRDHQGRPLIRVDDPLEVRWYAEGRQATRAEIDYSIATGLPLLKETFQFEDDPEAACAALDGQIAAAARWLPEGA